ncbi:unnamed protein product [Ixodes persulcatus]
MAFNFVAFCYIVALILTAFLIFMAVFHVIAFDELKTNYKNPIEQCDSLNPLVLPEYLIHLLYNVLFLFSGEFFTLLINLPLIAYHINRWVNRPISFYSLSSRAFQPLGGFSRACIFNGRTRPHANNDKRGCMALHLRNIISITTKFLVWGAHTVKTTSQQNQTSSLKRSDRKACNTVMSR